MALAAATVISPFRPLPTGKSKHNHLLTPKFEVFSTKSTKISRTVLCSIFQGQKCSGALLGAAALALTTFVGHCCAAELPAATIGSSLQFNEPSNALSLPTWAVHVSSVVEWVTAMALVWQYGEKSGIESWKGLSWGMVPLLGGAFCACTWHFFYNAESLEILVALQGALTLIGNVTMCVAAFRIFKATQEAMYKRFGLKCQHNDGLNPCQEVENGRKWCSNRGLYSRCTGIQECRMTTPYMKGDFTGIMEKKPLAAIF